MCYPSETHIFLGHENFQVYPGVPPFCFGSAEPGLYLEKLPVVYLAKSLTMIEPTVDGGIPAITTRDV